MKDATDHDDDAHAALAALLARALALADEQEELHVAVLIAQAIDQLPPAR